MADLDFYRRNLGVKDLQQLDSLFCDTLIETNCTYEFFVDWDKATGNRDAFRNELALLSGLKGASYPARYLRQLIQRYPEVARVFPLLLAVRDPILKVLRTLKPPYEYVIYRFDEAHYSARDINCLVEFCERTGLLNALSSMQSPIDYMLGAEVGLDTNARKNRSGFFMEAAVGEALSNIVSKNPSIGRVSQKKFAYLQRELGIQIRRSLAERKFDEVVLSANSGANIEVNFYGVTGSKPTEIVDAYRERKRELDAMGWKFIWVTDGPGWPDMTEKRTQMVRDVDYVLNLHMLSRGLLEKIILERLK